MLLPLINETIGYDAYILVDNFIYSSDTSILEDNIYFQKSGSHVFNNKTTIFIFFLDILESVIIVFEASMEETIITCLRNNMK